MLVIVRHGRTAANAAALLQGRADHPLDELGVQQAVAVARELAGADRVIASPLVRAQQTAAGIGPVVETDARWIELDYGDLEDTRIADVPADTWLKWRSDDDYVPAGGESHAAMQRRVIESCSELLEASRESTIVVVSHVGPIKATLAWVFGLPATSGWRCHLDHASITRISAGPHGPVLRSFNETAHLGSQ